MGSHDLEADTEKKHSKLVHDDGTILQSIWVRHNSISNTTDSWYTLGSQLRHVLYCGSISWAVFILSKIF